MLGCWTSACNLRNCTKRPHLAPPLEQELRAVCGGAGMPILARGALQICSCLLTPSLLPLL